MRLFRYFVVLNLGFILSTAFPGQALNRRVLFLGNSYTHSNNLPQILSDFALSVNDSLEYDQNTPGGYTLDQHFTDTNSTNKIMLSGWDYVVMQEQSQLPSFEDYLSGGPGNLSALIEQYNPCARKMYYMTWGRKNGDAGQCATWPPVCTYEGMDSLLHLRYIQMASFTNAEVSPVGYVWRYIRQNHPQIELYWTDGSHPSLAGSYAAAACFYSVLFRKDPTLTNYNPGIDSVDAANIRLATKLIVYDSLANWDFANHQATADFNFSIGLGTNEVITSNRSMNADFYMWDWGDGNFDSTKTPHHNYSADGTYTIALTASKCDLGILNNSTIQKNVNFCSHTPLIHPDSLVQCPNTVDTLWTQVFDSYQWLDSENNLLSGDTNQYFVPSGGYGYSVETSMNNCLERSASVYVEGYSTGFVIYHVDSISNSIIPDSLCAGDTVLLILQPNKPAGNDFYFQWNKNGIDIPFATDDSLFVNTSGDYQVTVKNIYCPNYIDYQSVALPLMFLNCNIGLEEIEVVNLVELYPNPTHGSATIHIDNRLTGIIYSLKDILGRKVMSGKLIDAYTPIQINHLVSGIYFLEIDNHNSRSIKLVKTNY